MVEVDDIVKDTKLQLKKFQGEINGAERLVNLMRRAGVPVTQEMAKVNEMKQQAQLVKKALAKDKAEHG